MWLEWIGLIKDVYQLVLLSYLIFLITLGSLSLSHSANLMRSCIFSRVSLSILANYADISSILFLRSSISFSLFFSLSSCYFLVRAIVSLFFSASLDGYLTLPPFQPIFWRVTLVNRCTPSASVYTDASLQIYLNQCLHNRYHLFLLRFEIPFQVHHSFFDLVLTGSVLIGALLFDHFLEHFIPSCVCRSWTLLFKIWTRSAS